MSPLNRSNLIYYDDTDIAGLGPSRREHLPEPEPMASWLPQQQLWPQQGLQQDRQAKTANQEENPQQQQQKEQHGWRSMFRSLNRFLAFRAQMPTVSAKPIRQAFSRLRCRLQNWTTNQAGICSVYRTRDGKLPKGFEPTRIIYFSPRVRVVEGVCKSCQKKSQKWKRASGK